MSRWDTSNIKSMNSLFQNNTQFDKIYPIGTFTNFMMNMFFNANSFQRYIQLEH